MKRPHCEFWLLIIVALMGFAAHAKMPKWNKRMQELSQALKDVMPEVVSQSKDRKKLEQGARRLSELVHSLKVLPGGESMLPPDADPSVSFISDIFEKEVHRAYSAVREGHTDYARGILRNVTAYCIACHGRTGSGPDFAGVDLTKQTQKMQGLQRAELLAATRQSDAAFDEFMKIVSDEGKAGLRQLEWRRAVQRALLLAVRVKQDPDLALKVVEAAQKNSSTQFVKQYTTGWKDAIVAWKREASAQPRTEDGLYSEASRLYAAAIAAQRFPLDHSADVYFLRATALAHNQLGLAPQGARSADAFLLIGQSHEVLNDPALWPIHEVYYMACIRRAPQTATSKKCFERYEESVYVGYSGSGGVSVPDDVLEQLAELKSLAFGEPQVKKGK